MGQKYEVVAAASASSLSDDDEAPAPAGGSPPDRHDSLESSSDYDDGMSSYVGFVPPSRPRVRLLIGAAFAAGAAAGGCAVGALALALSPSRGPADGAAGRGAVSYGFLETDKGSRTLRLLLGDLLLPPDEPQSSSPDDLAGLTGPRRALTRLSSLMESDAQVGSSCHPLAHNLGRAAYEAFGGHEGAFDGMIGTDDAELVRLCNAAYLHGVIEYHLKETPPDRVVEEARSLQTSLCSRLTNVDKGEWECVHGIGHGIVQSHRGEHSETSVLRAALDSCRSILPGPQSSACENGIWMDHFAVSGNILAMDGRMMATDLVGAMLAERSSAGGAGKEREWGDGPGEPAGGWLASPKPATLRVCEELSSGDHMDCYIYLATQYLLVHPGDYAGSVDFCLETSVEVSPRSRDLCVGGVGSQVGKENLSDFSVLERVCTAAGSRGHGYDRTCFQWGVSYYLMSTGRMPGVDGLCDGLDSRRFRDLC